MHNLIYGMNITFDDLLEDYEHELDDYEEPSDGEDEEYFYREVKKEFDREFMNK